MPDKITANDMFTGLFAALAVKEEVEFDLRDKIFDRAIERVYQKVEDLSSEEDLEVRFRVKLNRLHGDSELVRGNVFGAAQRGLISVDNPQYQVIRLKITADGGEKLFKTLPGTREFYLALADELIDVYSDSTV